MNKNFPEEYYHFAAGGVTGMRKPSMKRGNISKAAAVSMPA